MPETGAGGSGAGMEQQESEAAAPSLTAPLATAPLEIAGDWAESAPADGARVAERLRQAALAGVALVSDRQPARLKIECRLDTVPHIWLDDTDPEAASVVVDGTARNWCRMAYQLGHEMGHVVCNSWQLDALPLKPSQWLEECFAEAFSLRALALLADGWDREPVLPALPDFGKHLRRYRELTVAQYRAATPNTGLHNWFAANRRAVENNIGGHPARGPALLMILGELDRDPGCVADLGALNRWPGRAAEKLEDYLSLWRESCAELGAPGRLPARLTDVLFFDEPAPTDYASRPAQPNLQRPQRWIVREEVVALDALVSAEHPVRAVWGFAAGLDLSGYAGEAGGPPRPAPALLLALWLWASAEGVGSVDAVARLSADDHAYRWLCGGVAVDAATLLAFRAAEGVERLLAEALAALAEAGALGLDLVPPETLKARRLAGPGALTRRRRLAALFDAAAARLAGLAAELDRNDPTADEWRRRDIAARAARPAQAQAEAALAARRELLQPRGPQ